MFDRDPVKAYMKRQQRNPYRLTPNNFLLASCLVIPIGCAIGGYVQGYDMENSSHYALNAKADRLEKCLAFVRSYDPKGPIPLSDLPKTEKTDCGLPETVKVSIYPHPDNISVSSEITANLPTTSEIETKIENLHQEARQWNLGEPIEYAVVGASIGLGVDLMVLFSGF